MVGEIAPINVMSPSAFGHSCFFFTLVETYANVMSDDRGALSLLAQALSPWQLDLSSKCN